MEALTIIPDLEQQGFRDSDYAVVEHLGPVAIGGMVNGTANDKPVFMIGLDMGEDEGVLVVQTTLALFLTAADALKARYGDPR